MAGDWIPVGTTTTKKPKVLRIARVTGRSRWEVAGLLIEFWCWASDNVGACVDGHASLENITIADLCVAIGADEAFWKAVSKEDWLRVFRRCIVIPRADEWISVGAKARLLKTKRQSLWRKGVDGAVDGGASPKTSTREEKSGLRPSEKRTSADRRAGVFSKLTADTLRDTAAMVAWHSAAAGKPKPVIGGSEADRLFMLAAAECALDRGENAPALFAWLVAGSKRDGIRQEHEDRANLRLQELDKSEPCREVAAAIKRKELPT